MTKITPALSALAAVLALAALAGPARAEDGAGGARWSLAGEQVVLDARTGLKWTRSDNAADADWRAARRYCESLRLDGARWRLPSAAELMDIHAADAAGVACGGYAGKPFTCRTSPLFRLSGPWFWSATPGDPAPADGAERAFDVNLINGSRHPFGTKNADYGRALCVERR